MCPVRLIAVGLGLVAALLCRLAWACSCSDAGAEREMSMADLVFVGRAQGPSWNGNRLTQRIDVLHVLKGKALPGIAAGEDGRLVLKRSDVIPGSLGSGFAIKIGINVAASQ
jgi:hypothetical protein